MKIVLFYAKPGCATNAKQKKSLREAGCTIIERNLLENDMTLKELESFLKNRPVSEWFNPNAPTIKSGEVDPHSMSEAVALQLLLRDPILIKRPLMVISGRKLCGFDPKTVEALLSIPFEAKVSTTCSDIALKL